MGSAAIGSSVAYAEIGQRDRWNRLLVEAQAFQRFHFALLGGFGLRFAEPVRKIGISLGGWQCDLIGFFLDGFGRHRLFGCA